MRKPVIQPEEDILSITYFPSYPFANDFSLRHDFAPNMRVIWFRFVSEEVMGLEVSFSNKVSPKVMSIC